MGIEDEGRRRRKEHTKHSTKRKRDRSRSGGRDGKVREKRLRDSSDGRRHDVVGEEQSYDSRRSALASTYSELDNPFNDINLGQQFKWHKKIDKERKRGISPSTSRRLEVSRRKEAEGELALLNKKRMDRDAERLLREEEESRMARLADTAQMSDWLAKEGDFQLEQERARAAIRIKERRAKAVDFLAHNLRYASSDFKANTYSDDLEEGTEIDLDEPYNIVENLSAVQADELRDDIQKYLVLERDEVHIEFWTNMMLICEDYIAKHSPQDGSGRPKNVDIASAVQTEIETLLTGKNYEELSLLQTHVQSKLTGSEPVDVDYWESLLKSLVIWKAKAKLKTMHEVIVLNRLEHLRRKQRDDALQAQQQLLVDAKLGTRLHGGDKEYRRDVSCAIQYLETMSPKLIPLDQLTTEDTEIEIISEETDSQNLLSQRNKVNNSLFIAKTTAPAVSPRSKVVETQDQVPDSLWQAEAERNLEEEEEVFSLEETIVKPAPYSWEDKYRPRKPRYFNRVHTGYEWNKYNQTHYDTDNPPPKVVQGYKFNIFYPDLIDSSKAPSYKIVREPGNSETVLLYFTAGPPYEDVAFRIVNREWEYSHKRGFRSSFDHGCLSLWFNFRRNYYRK